MMYYSFELIESYGKRRGISEMGIRERSSQSRNRARRKNQLRSKERSLDFSIDHWKPRFKCFYHKKYSKMPGPCYNKFYFTSTSIEDELFTPTRKRKGISVYLGYCALVSRMSCLSLVYSGNWGWVGGFRLKASGKKKLLLRYPLVEVPGSKSYGFRLINLSS